MGFELGNTLGVQDNILERNAEAAQSQRLKIDRFKSLVREEGLTPNEAKKKIIEEFQLNRKPGAGTPKWMTKGKEELIAEGFDYKSSPRGPENVGGAKKAQDKRSRFVENLDERIKRTKQKTGLGKQYELAHTANIFQAKKLGIDYPIDALAIQTQNVNNKVAEALSDELKPLYRKQLKLVNKLKRKNTPSLQNQLDKINFQISETVATGGKQGGVAANVLKPIIVDPQTLKGSILDLGFDTSTEIMATPGATTKGTAAGSLDDAFARGSVESRLKNIRSQFENNTGNVCSIFGKANGGSVKACLTSFDDAVKNNPQGLFQKIINFAKSPGTKTFGIGAGVGAAIGLVKAFSNDDPTSYLSNEDQQKNMLVEMATDPISIDTEKPAILDYQLPALGATLAGTTALAAPSTIKASKSRAFGIEKKKPRPGMAKTGLRVLGRGLGVAASPALLAPFMAGDIASQVAEGDSFTDIATDPLNYTYPIFAEQTDKLTKGLSPTLRKIARLGLPKIALRGLSRAGIAGLAGSLAIQGMDLFDD
jgi:hypothetical protein